MQLKKQRASDIALSLREQRAFLNLFHNASAQSLKRLSPSLLRFVLQSALKKPANKPLFLPVAYGKAALGEQINLSIDPTKLTFRLHDWVHTGERPYHVNDYFLCAADWAPALNPIAKTPVYIEAMQLHAAGLDYKSTPAYENYLKRLERGIAPTRNKAALDTREKINLYFERFISLFNSIQTHGLVSIEQARRIATTLNSSSAIRSWRTNFGESNLGIAIGPTGEVVALPGGQHRLAIAIAMQLPRIPVELRLIHTAYLPDPTIISGTEWLKKIEGQLRSLDRQARHQ